MATAPSRAAQNARARILCLRPPGETTVRIVLRWVCTHQAIERRNAAIAAGINGGGGVWA